MIIKDARKKPETFLYKDIAIGNAFEHEGDFFIRAYQIFWGDEMIPENVGLGVDLNTGRILRIDFDAEVIPVYIESSVHEF